MSIQIANAAGFFGDRLDAARGIVDKVEVDYLTLEYLAELTMSILAHQREKNPSLGYAGDVLEVLQSVCPALYLQAQLKIVTNAGGVNPLACAEAASAILAENGSENIGVGVARGDDLLGRLEELEASGCEFANFDTGEPFRELKKPIVSANAYLGAAPIVRALADGARVVITGRVADASLTVGPAVHEFDWAFDDWDRLAAATVAGHLIECGAQVTGGYSTRWRDYQLTDVGYPIARVDADGNSTITKPPGSGGAVTRQTVAEQLVYEIGDPARYMTPDVVANFTTVTIAERAANEVDVRGATGATAPDDYKVSLAYHDGFTATGELLVWGADCVDKARATAEMIFARTEAAGAALDVKHVELLGAGDAAGVAISTLDDSSRPTAPSMREVVLRMTAQSSKRDLVTRFTREIAPMITSGPFGLAGYASGRARVRPIFAYWPALVPKNAIEAIVEVRAAKEWM